MMQMTLKDSAAELNYLLQLIFKILRTVVCKI